MFDVITATLQNIMAQFYYKVITIASSYMMSILKFFSLVIFCASPWRQM